MDCLSSDQVPFTEFMSGAHGGSLYTGSQALFASANGVSSGARWVLRLCQFCAQLCYAAIGGWRSLSPVVSGAAAGHIVITARRAS